jgi:hypothetical protein
LTATAALGLTPVTTIPVIGTPIQTTGVPGSPGATTTQFNQVTIKVNRPQLSPEDIQKLEDGMKKVEAGRE